MKNILQIVLIILVSSLNFAQEIFTLEKAISVALHKSFGIKSAEYS
ncbi:MAG: hypothetical protein V3V16_11685 [Melioribacteraceae bacterium]